MNRSERLRRWIEEDQIELDELTEEIFLNFCTEDFKITNLHENTLLGQGYEFAHHVIKNDSGLIFKVVQIITAGDFEVVNYEVTNQKGEIGQGTILYRYRGDKVCEMLLLDHK